MGMAILMELGRPWWTVEEDETDFARALPPLAAFGLIHGSHEWFEMFLLIQNIDHSTTTYSLVEILRIALLGASFICLLGFGLLVTARLRRTQVIFALACAFGLWLAGVGLVYQISIPNIESFSVADVFTRYSLAIPGACLAAFGLFAQRKHLSKQASALYGWDTILSGLAFLVYGLVGQLFTSALNALPCFSLSANCFLQSFGFPIQVLRTAMAILAAIFIIRLLRVFQFEKQTRMMAVSEAQRLEQIRLQEMRGELLHRTVKAQEAERQRIARELHDETGQTLTAIGMGLRGLKKNIPNNPRRASEQVEKLENLANSGMEELQRVVAGLHPSSLDDLGLLPALRWMAHNTAEHISLKVEVAGQGNSDDLSMETRITLYRIAQEALANVIRHSDARHAFIELAQNSDYLEMSIRDDGRGFDPYLVFEPDNPIPSWGLMGMQERAALIGATMQIISAPGEGATIRVRVPLRKTKEVSQ